MSATAMVNLITKNTTKEQMTEAYKTYPDTTPNGFTAFNASTVEPIICEIPYGSSVLDVGCNSGEMMAILKEQKKCRVVGVDISETALKVAKSKRLRVFNASAEKLPFKDKRFDVVIMREVLTHIHEPLKAIQEAKRVLKKDGFLIGSVPHANLERIVWDDARLHHRYYNEENLKKDLSESFEVNHLKLLNGSQFSVSFANSLLGDQTVEIIFKSGNEGLPRWDQVLLEDKKTLRVWMGPTQPPGDVYYRMTGYAEKMNLLKGVEIGYDHFSYKSGDGCSEWQRKILPDNEGNPVSGIALHELEKCIKLSNPLVFQITYYEDILDFLVCVKEAYPEKKLITECDDWLFDVPSYNIASNPYKPGSGKEKVAYGQLEISDAIIASTSFIKEGLEKFFPQKPIYIIPNSVDLGLWERSKSDGKMPKKEGVVRICYSGCGNHNGDLEIVKPVLLALLEEFENLEIIIAGQFECFKDVNHPRFITPGVWSDIISYPSMVKSWEADIGIAPLRDNNFNRAKSNLRWIEYSAIKIPTVASNVRPFSESIKSGEGYLCSSKQDWYEKLKDLIENQSLRTSVGETTYQAIKERHNMDLIAKQYAKILREIRA